MKRSDLARQPVNIIHHQELIKKAAIHEAGHAAAIYFGNKRKHLPPVFFQIYLNDTYKQIHSEKCPARVEGGRLIHTLPSSIEAATYNFSCSEKQAYLQAFEADMINLLAGPLAEANYIALRDNELINPSLINFNVLLNYGGAFDLAIIEDYLSCINANTEQREHKLRELFLSAFYFVSDYANWNAITALADYMLKQSKHIIDCEEIISVLEANSDNTPLLTI
jgi:hypothetical protein